MKIVIANNVFFPYQRGGAEVVVRRLARDWQKAGHEVVIVALCPDKQSRQVEALTSDDNFKTVFWPSSYYRLASMSWLRRLLWHLPDCFGTRLTKKWIEFLKDFKPDLVIANNLTGLGYSLHFCCWKLGIKSVQIIHDLQYLEPSGLISLGQEKKLSSPIAITYQILTAGWFGYAKEIISPSDWLISCHHQRKWLVNNLWLRLSNPLPNQLPKAYRQPENLYEALFVGQLNKAKGIVWLAKNWQKFNQLLISNGLPTARLTIVGDGQDKNKIDSLAAKDENIKIIGRVDSAEVSSYLKKADVLLVTSFCYENWPTILTEAAINSCPAIATSHGGSGELARRLGYQTFTAGNLMSLFEAWQKTHQQLKNDCLVKDNDVSESTEGYLNKILNNLN